jgi:hypothetical protein
LPSIVASTPQQPRLAAFPASAAAVTILHQKTQIVGYVHSIIQKLQHNVRRRTSGAAAASSAASATAHLCIHPQEVKPGPVMLPDGTRFDHITRFQFLSPHNIVSFSLPALADGEYDVVILGTGLKE